MSEYKEKREKCLELKEYFIDEILADDLIQLNKYVALVLVVGKYQMEKFDNDIETCNILMTYVEKYKYVSSIVCSK